MIRFFLLVIILFTGSLFRAARAQNNIRPTVPVPNGFEVNSYTGNLYHSRTDLRIPGQGLNIDITFSYNVSRRAKDWGMGKGWTFTYNMAYKIDTSGVWIERADGRRDLYRKSGSEYVGPTGIHDALTEYETGKFYVQTKEGLRYYFGDAHHKKLTRVQDLNGNQVNLSYADTLLKVVTNASGHNLDFTWTNGRLVKIEDKTCTPERKVLYTYDTKGNPVAVTNPIGDVVRYVSDSTSKIIGYTDEAGNNMSMLYNANGSVKRVVSCATNHSFSYVSQQLKTYVTEQVNGQNVITTYQFDELGRVISKKGNCCGFDLDYVYDAANNVVSLIDGNKKQTLYEYDAKGNVVKETDPAGNTSIMAYEPSHNKVTSYTDKNGNQTTFQYDARGNLIQVNKLLGAIEKSTYDAKGNRISYTDANNYTTNYQYDINGNLSKITDAEAGVVTYSYDCYGNRLIETDAKNNTTIFEYNALNQLVKTTDALSNVTTQTYNKLKLLASVTNPLGKRTQYLYDGLGQRISVVLPLGNATHSEYDGQGNVIKETDANGNVTTYTYNNRKQPLTVTDPLGNSIFYEYDGAGNKIGETDKNGHVTRFEYDDLYRLTKVIDPLGGVIIYAYDAMGNRTAELDANGNRTTYQYDALRRLTRTTDALQHAVEYTYDKVGNKLTEKDKNGNTTAYTFDKLNRVKSVTDALTGVTTFVYDASGNIISEKDPLNRATTFSYDALNQLVSSINAKDDITSYTYDAAGNEKTITSPNGNVTTNTYDGNDQLTGTSDSGGMLSEVSYDLNMNTIAEKDGNGNITLHQYDGLNQLIKTTFPNGTSIQFFFDASGNKIRETDQQGNNTAFTVDKMNRVSVITDAMNFSSRFTYDAKGNLINITDANGNTTSYNYDPRNQLSKQIYADGSARTFSYDANGLLTKKTTAIGAQINYKYDQLNRLTERVYPGNLSDMLSYDATGYLVKAVNANAAISFDYDAAGRIIKEDNNGKATIYSYNTANKTKTIAYPSGTQIAWQLDERERLVEIKEGGTPLSTFDYDPADRLTGKRYRNGISTAYSYDKMNNLLSLTATPNNILNINYRYDESDKRTITERKHKPPRSEQYGYDNNFQLKSFVSGQLANDNVAPATSSQYTYDALGNRVSSTEASVSKTYVVNNLNQYTSINTNGVNAPPSYDKNGNLLSDGINSYDYDFESRLTSIQQGTDNVIYKYDALGRRASRTFAGVETLYFYDLDNLIEEVTNGSAKSYIYGNDIDQIIASKTGNDYYYYHTDDLNTVQALTNASGTLAEYYTYDPFGTPHIFSPADIELNASSINNILFTGRQYDFRFKSYNYRNREMSPVLGRFAQRDPLEYIDGLNSYSYINNDIINAADPLGLFNGKGVKNSLWGILEGTGGLIVGVPMAGTGVGAIPGVALSVGSAYKLGTSLGNLWNAIRDKKSVLTGSLGNDLAKAIDPCNNYYRRIGDFFDVGNDFTLVIAGGWGLAKGGYKFIKGGVSLIKVTSRIQAGSLKEFKQLVNQLSKPGSELTKQELLQFERLTEEFGGKLRYDFNPVKGKILKPHVQVEGLGSSVESRHIWLKNGVRR